MRLISLKRLLALDKCLVPSFSLVDRIQIQNMTIISDQARITQEIIINRSAIFGFILAHVRRADVAEDIFQDVCMTICEKWDEYDHARPFRAWAMGIARNEIRYHLRRLNSSSRRMVPLDPSIAEALVADHTWDDDINRERDALRHCMNQLTESGRRMLRLRYHENLDVEEIGKRIGWKCKSVAVALTRIRKNLFACIIRFLQVAECG